MNEAGLFLARALDAFFLEHRRCGELDSGVDDLPAGGYVVWMDCSCGAVFSRREDRGGAS